MRYSLKVFTWFRIPVFIHWSFVLIFAYVFWSSNHQNMGIMDYFWQVVAIIALFTCVLLHEFGHSLMARRFGVNTQDIILTPIGGIARLERMPERPRHELLVAIAGPMVNVVIAILLFLACKFIFFTGDIEWWYFKESVQEMLSLKDANYSEADMVLEQSGIQMPTWQFLLPLLLVINITMVLFNMLPAFPMDGGRVLRALLAMRVGRVRATKLASYLGQFVAVIFVVYGIYTSQFVLAMIGYFVFTTARQEDFLVRTDSLLNGRSAKQVMRTQFTRLNGNDWMQTPIELYTTHHERNFLVFEFSGQLLGYLDENAVVGAAKKKDSSSTVGEYVISPVELVHEHESLRYVYYMIVNSKKPVLGVVNEQMELVGVIDRHSLDQFLNLYGN